MSGFLPDIRDWALGGGAGQAANGDGDQENNGDGNEAAASAAPISEDEMRAKRMARLAALEKKDSSGGGSNNGGASSGGEAAAGSSGGGPSSMEVDKPAGDAQPMEVDEVKSPVSSSSNKASSSSPTTKDVAMEPAPKKKIKAPPSPAEALVKLRRKKILLLRRVLLITFGDPSERTAPCVHLNLDDDDIYNVDKSPRGVQVRHIAELLAARLSLSPSHRNLETVPPQTNIGLIAYLGGCHKKAGEEIKDLRQCKRKDENLEELIGILEEIRNQVVSYAASSLMVPDLFELGNNATLQLAKCLPAASIDPVSSITFDVLGKNSSFYCRLCEELHSQDAEAFASVIGEVAKHITDSLNKLNSLMDEGSVSEGMPGNALLLTSALRELCTSKKAAAELAKMPSFLLPPANAPTASERVTPSGAMDSQMALLRTLGSISGQRLPADSQSYVRRSGRGLEKETILGLVLRLGMPREPPGSVLSSFSNAYTRPKYDIDQTLDGFRRQLDLYQGRCHELVKGLIVAGEEPRKKVIQWFIDALLLNVNAGGQMADRTKVSSEELLMNFSVILLKLCEPFINDPKKALLIDPAFVSSPDSHGGIYTLMGDDALPRLGENVSDTEVPYNPKNAFIPLCFFFCSRLLTFTIVPGGSQYENIYRHVAVRHRQVRQENGDPGSDRRFNYFLVQKYWLEIMMMNPTYVTDVFRYYNMAAGIFLNMEKDLFRTMPEHIVEDYCSVLLYASKSCPNLLSGLDLGNLFRLTVKLLTKDYANLVRNYNLRALLGDVLHDVFLPKDSDDRYLQVPASVTCDPLAGGQPYLTSDKLSKESLAPSLLLLYGEVENTGYYDKNDHRTKIAALLKFLWSSPEHKPAFKRITEDKDGFIVFANGIINEMNDKFSTVMENLPSIRTVQLQMANPQEWAALSEEEREIITERQDNHEQSVRHFLPLCNAVMKMLGFLNTDKDIRDMFLLPDMCPRLANMLMHVLNKLVGTRGLDLKVDNPESYNFKPKEMLQDLCVIFSSFAAADDFQIACARSGCYTPDLMNKSVKTCRKLGLLVGESMELFALLATKVEDASKVIVSEEADLYEDAPDEFLDSLTQEIMTDPVLLPTSNEVVDRTTIAHHLLNNDFDPFNRKTLSMDDIVPAEELKEKMDAWRDAKVAARDQSKE